MRLDIITEPSKTVEVRWFEINNHTCLGLAVLVGREYKVRLVRGRFGGGISIYPRQVTLTEFEAHTDAAMPLPAALQSFVGSTFTVNGAPGGVLQIQRQAIELLDEIPKGAQKGEIGWREALYRTLEKDETIGIFKALGIELDVDLFESYADLAKTRDAERAARKRTKK